MLSSTSTLFSDCSLLSELLLFRVERVAISVLASVVSDGSPGSSLLMLAIPLPTQLSLVALDRVRGRLAGGLEESIEAEDFLCLVVVLERVAESSASSPEASREEGCSKSFGTEVGAALRFRLPVSEEDGEDIAGAGT